MSEKTKKTHWRELLETNFLSGDELPENGIVVTIEKHYKEKLYSKEAGKKKNFGILKFVGIDKPLILTNRKANQITTALGSKFVEDWDGKKIHIFPKDEKWFGKNMQVINVKEANVKKEILNPLHKKWDSACEALKNGKTTIEGIEKHYTLSKKVKEALAEHVPEPTESK